MLTRRALLAAAGTTVAGLVPHAARSAQRGGTIAAPSVLMTTLAEYMASAGARALPEEALEHTRQHVLDTLAAMLSGALLPPGEAALRFARSQGGTGVATVVGSPLGATAIDAALANGVLAHADETDDSHSPSQSHPGAPVVAAALAAGEQFGIDGARFLRAVALGYDVGPRVTMAMGGADFRAASSMSTHAVAGTFGAAAAAACAAGLSSQQMRFVLDYTSQQASGLTVWGRDTGHVEKGFVFGGMPARNGVTSAVLVREGWTGVDDVFTGPDNFFQAYAPNARPEMVVEELGRRFEVTRTDIKKWTVGSPIQGPLDAIERLRQARPFTAADVASVTVRLAPTVARVVDDRELPDICLQHMVAVMLVDGTVSFAAAHDVGRMQAPDVRRQRAKVRLVPDAALAPLLPVRVADVEIVWNDGTRASERVTAVRGTPRNPMTRDEVVAKARDLVDPVIGPARAARLVAAVFSLDARVGVRTLRPLLQRD